MLSDDEFNLILNGHGTLIARGTVDYTDGFGEQTTQFFCMYEPTEGWTADAPEGWADIFEGLIEPKD